MTPDIEKQLEAYEAACLAYARDARLMRAGECDRGAMVGAFLTIRAAFFNCPSDLDEPVAVTAEDGGLWHPLHGVRGVRVHAIKFKSGRVWDIVNGFRS